jgi:hypothetical protein
MRLITSAVVILSIFLPALTLAEPPAPEPVRQFMTDQGFAVFKLNKLPTGHEVIEVVINGEAGIFVLDSGAGVTVVRHDRLTKFGIGLASNQQQGAGAGGSIPIISHPITSFALDGRAVPLSQVYGTNLDSVVARLKAATGVEIDGVIGQDILSRYAAIINVGSGELYLKLPAR